jgi:hypothetical protein
MSGPEPRYHYSVVRDLGGPSYADVALIRSSGPHGVLDQLLQRDRRDTVVLHHRTFRPKFELLALEAYAARLERTAEHGNNGTLGCFVDAEPRRNGIVHVTLYERWFDGQHLRCERLAGRDFDSTDESALVASSEFQAELQAWAEQRNHDRDAAYLDAAAEEAAQTERAAERANAAHELARILTSVNKRG